MTRRLAVLLVACFALTLHADTIRLGRDVVPRAQAISLTADPRADSFTGATLVDLDVKKPTSTLRFHAQDITITSLKVNGIDAPFETGPQNTVGVTLSAPLRQGRATLAIEYSAPFNRQAVGLYKMLRDGEPHLFTQFEAIDARRAFPSWDEPGFKLPYQLTVTIPRQYDAVSNTPVASHEDRGEWQTIRFASTKPLPSYLLALAVGQFDSVAIPGMSVPGRVYAPKGQGGLTKLAIEITPPVLAAMERYFAAPHPFEKVDLIAVPEFWAGAMENPGAITFRDNYLLLDSAAATPSQKRNLVRIVAHELAHMWFGDLVTMEWWDDLWLNESFADWMGDKITEQLYPELGHELLEVQGIQNVMNTDARPSASPVRNRNADAIEAMRSVGLAYNKGKAVLRMFELWMGPEKFRQGVLDHLRANAWGNAEAADFWAALARHAPKKMTAAMASFIEQPGVPLVTVEPVEGNRVRLSQRRFVNGGSSNLLWQIPVGIRYSDGSQTRTETVFLDRSSMTVTLSGRPAWIFPHADASGYYRWEMPEAAMSALAQRGGDALTVKERLAFIGNVSALFRAGAMRGDVFLDTLSRFAHDRDPNVTAALLTPTGLLRVTFDAPQTRVALASYMRTLLRPGLDRMGMTPRPGESPAATQLRPRLMAWLGDEADDREVRHFAKQQAAKYLADPSSVDASIVSAALNLAAMEGDSALFEEYRTRFETAATPTDRARFLSGLGEFREPSARARALEYSLRGPLRTQEFFSIISPGAMATDEERQRVFEWVTANYDPLVAKLPRGLGGSSISAVAGGCDEQRLEAARKFFFDEKRRSESSERQMTRVAEQVSECVALRSSQMQAVSAYLQRPR